MKPDNPMRQLRSASRLAHYEKENYVAYYQKDWLKLLRVSIGLVKRILRAFFVAGDVCRLSRGSRRNCLCAVPGK